MRLNDVFDNFRHEIEGVMFDALAHSVPFIAKCVFTMQMLLHNLVDKLA